MIMRPISELDLLIESQNADALLRADTVIDAVPVWVLGEADLVDGADAPCYDRYEMPTNVGGKDTKQ